MKMAVISFRPECDTVYDQFPQKQAPSTSDYIAEDLSGVSLNFMDVLYTSTRTTRTPGPADSTDPHIPLREALILHECLPLRFRSHSYT